MRNLFFIGAIAILLFSFFISLPQISNKVFAQENSFVTIINPIRGDDFWDLKDQKPVDVVKEQINILTSEKVPGTFLIRYDALKNSEILSELKGRGVNFEKGLFLEITPSLTKDAAVNYRQSESWHFAESVLLTGYDVSERKKLIDTLFEKFKSEFGAYPKSVGAWWVDANSLKYMQEKYGITGALIVADQYSTDGYQIWGQYWSTPYYPSLRNALVPPQKESEKIPVVLTQWAARDPINGYGKGVEESTYSVQANDYTDYHDLGIKYFSDLVDLYTGPKNLVNNFGQIVVGIENSYNWKKYGQEYKKQIQTLAAKRNQLKIVSQEDFSSWYLSRFPTLSPDHLIYSDDPLRTDKKVVWYMNPFYRVGLFINKDEVSIRDIRQYIEGSEELCFEKSCKTINFATSAVRVLDDVTFGHRLIIDEGQIKDLKVQKDSEKVVVTYTNAANQLRNIEFLPRDISIDGKISSIDGFILDATNKSTESKQSEKKNLPSNFIFSLSNISSAILSTIIFLLFVIFVFFIPGLVVIGFVKEVEDFGAKIYIAIIVGIVQFTLFSFLSGILSFKLLPAIITLFFLAVFVFKKQYKLIQKPKLTKSFLTVSILIFLGTTFQVIPTFRSGMNFDYGIGFWGPNGHDGVWHIALSKELMVNVPPNNPAFAGEVLSNYHYFSDLLNAYTAIFTRISVEDLLFRFYPIFFSLLLGYAGFLLAEKIFKKYTASLISVYLIYFASSFGFIVEYIHTKSFGGESSFWANQPVSFNLNPPFAISIIILTAIFLLITLIGRLKNWPILFVVILLSGGLIQFKAYAFILLMATLLIIGLFYLIKKQPGYLIVLVGSIAMASFLVIPNTNFSVDNTSLFVFAPFWFIHSMIDSPDRVGWMRLSIARTSGFESGNWFKFFASEIIGLSLFILGNFGIRVVGFFTYFIKKIIDLESELLHNFLCVFLVLSILMPIFFIQAGNPWNTIQFLYYGIFVSSILAGGVFATLLKKKVRPFGAIVLSLLLLITPLSSIATAKGYLASTPHAHLPKGEKEALDELSKLPKGIVLSYPYDKKIKEKVSEPWPLYVYETSSYISAFSSQPSFYEDEIQQIILQTDYKTRNAIAKNFFQDARLESEISDAKRILAENNIKYIYLNKHLSEPLSENSLGLEKVFDNSDALIYKVLK